MIKYTYEDYQKLPYNDLSFVLWELINGVIQFAPSPNLMHQRLSSRLHLQLGNFIENTGKNCEIFTEPTDVYLKEDLIVKPDIFIACDKEKLTRSRCNGIPDLVVEVLSPSNKKNDLPGGSKFQIYEEFMLKEYWIVDPLDEENITLTQFTLEDYKLVQKQAYTKKDNLQSHIFPDLEIDLDKVLSM